jgi:hypothetical protein
VIIQHAVWLYLWTVAARQGLARKRQRAPKNLIAQVEVCDVIHTRYEKYNVQAGRRARKRLPQFSTVQEIDQKSILSRVVSGNSVRSFVKRFLTARTRGGFAPFHLCVRPDPQGRLARHYIQSHRTLVQKPFNQIGSAIRTAICSSYSSASSSQCSNCARRARLALAVADSSLRNRFLRLLITCHRGRVQRACRLNPGAKSR